MSNFEPGQRVEADISAMMAELGVSVSTHGTIKGPGTAPGTFLLQTDAPFNGDNVFQLEASCLTTGPRTILPRVG